MMKHFKHAVLLSLLVCNPLYAAGDITGKVTAIKAQVNKKKVKFELTSDEVGDSCNSSGWFVINTAKDGGDNAYLMVLDAYNNGRNITVETPKSDKCGEEAGAMTVKAVMIGVHKGVKFSDY